MQEAFLRLTILADTSAGTDRYRDLDLIRTEMNIDLV